MSEETNKMDDPGQMDMLDPDGGGVTPEVTMAKAVPHVPADWKTALKWPQQLSLAAEVSPTPVSNRVEVEAALTLALANQGGPVPAAAPVELVAGETIIEDAPDFTPPADAPAPDAPTPVTPSIIMTETPRVVITPPAAILAKVSAKTAMEMKRGHDVVMGKHRK